MPILKKECDLSPPDLFEFVQEGAHPDCMRWWAAYTLSRREKELMRRLAAVGERFYAPTVERRHRSPNGRLRSVFQPLFPSYVFVFGEETTRQTAFETDCVSRYVEVPDSDLLTRELDQVRRLVASGKLLTPESRLENGQKVRVRSGVFAGFEGFVIRRDGETRLMISVTFAGSGASVLLDDCQLETI